MTPGRGGVLGVLRPRSRDLGGVRVRRLLPSRSFQRIGPFIFFDHLGPVRLGPGRGIDVGPHPHIGLATVTYLFEGSLVHRDSLGSVETIRPGEINWMHAGAGIVHSERTGPGDRLPESNAHGIQLWAALPAEQENTPPTFDHYRREALPVWIEPGLAGRVLVGHAFGRTSPVVTRSPTLCVDVALELGRHLLVPEAPERGVYVVEGRVSLGPESLSEGEMAVLAPGPSVVLTADATTRVLVLGGEALSGERHIWWNFVSSSLGRIERARVDWSEGRFPPVPGDDEMTPLPPGREPGEKD